MLEVRGLGMSFGADPLFSDIGFSIADGERLALLGPNGSGKSTILCVLAGELTASEGQVRWQGGRQHVVHVPQETSDDGDPRSAGQRLRARIEAALRERPGLLLLDEPTNHLDADARIWLERSLEGFRGAVLLVSHDRSFVDRVASRVLHLERGKLASYSGNYSAFLSAHAAGRQAGERRHQDFEKRRKDLHEAAVRQRNWAETSHHAAGERNPFGKRRAAKLMHKALATEERLVRLEGERPDRPFSEPRLSFAFLPMQRLPRVLVRVEDLGYTYPDGHSPALQGLKLELFRGERLCVLGPNGSGKTTFMRLLVAAAQGGLPEPTEGRIHVHPAVRILHFAQERILDPRTSALQQMLAAGAPDAATARSLLGHFRLLGDAALRPADSLSPGEQARAACALALVSGPDILILDEPTNHLDIEGCEALEEALGAYPGTVVFSSHDEWFRDRVATRTLALTAAKTDALAPDDLGRDILKMRLAALTARLPRTKAGEAHRIEEEIRGIVDRLKGGS